MSSCDRTKEFTEISERKLKQLQHEKENASRGDARLWSQSAEHHIKSTQSNKSPNNTIQTFTNASTSKPKRRESNAYASKFSENTQECLRTLQSINTAVERLERMIGGAQLFASPAEVERHVEAVRRDVTAHQQLLQETDNLGEGAARRANAHGRAHIGAARDELKRRARHAAKRFADVLRSHSNSVKRRRRTQALLVGGGSTPNTSSGPASAATAIQNSGTGMRRRAAASAVPTGASSSLLHVKSYDTQRRQAQQTEQTIVELAGMFQRISHSVAEQGELFARVGVTLEESESAITRAQAQLLRYWDNIRGDRAFAIKLLLALIVVCGTVMYMMP